jgi:hypothetical protein
MCGRRKPFARVRGVVAMDDLGIGLRMMLGLNIGTDRLTLVFG